MRIVYFGTSDFAVPILRAVSEWVTLVVTQPDRPKGRGRILTKTPVKIEAETLHLPVTTPERSRAEEFIEQVRAEKPDALLVASYGQILSQSLLDVAVRGGINLHASLLPKYRGAAPIQRAILEGETQTGVTLMQMDKGMDTGDIITMRATEIQPSETAGELEQRLSNISAEMAKEWLPKIVSGDYTRTPQPKEGASLAPKLSTADAEIAPAMQAKDAFRIFRASTPRPGCTLLTRFGRIKVTSCQIVPKQDEPGTFQGTYGSSAAIAFTGGTLLLDEVKPEGRSKMSGAGWANGLRLTVGTRI